MDILYYKMKRTADLLEIRSGLLNWRFKNNGLLHSVAVRESGGVETVIVREGACGIRLTLADGRICVPDAAAFPEYSSRQIVPFLASSGVAPHLPLGVQFVSSPLAHPPSPGVNDRWLRPQARIFRVFSMERDVTFLHSGNCGGIFTSTGAPAASLLMLSACRNRALLVVGCFGKEDRERAVIGVDWEKCGFDPAGKNIYRLAPGPDAPDKVEKITGARRFECHFAGYPAMAFLISSDPFDCTGWECPYPALGKEAAAYLAWLETQRARRFDSPPGKERYLSVCLDNSICTSLEDDNFFDLFDNTLELGIFTPRGGFTVLGELTRSGLTAPGGTSGSNRLMPGDTSPPVALHELLPPGRHRLAVRTIHMREPFYSFITLKLFFSPDGPAECIEFCNELEPDRAYLNWETVLL
jgi:hypothetical protein